MTTLAGGENEVLRGICGRLFFLKLPPSRADAAAPPPPPLTLALLCLKLHGVDLTVEEEGGWEDEVGAGGPLPLLHSLQRSGIPVMSACERRSKEQEQEQEKEAEA